MNLDSLQELGDDKLIYDARSGRFYEKKIEEVCREEYCAIDETTGEQKYTQRRGGGATTAGGFAAGAGGDKRELENRERVRRERE